MANEQRPDHPSSYLAADGGGTGSRISLVLDGERFDVESGPTNASTDLMGTLDALREGLRRLSRVAGLTPSELSAIPGYFGIAGVISRDIGEGLENALPLSHARVEEDRIAAFAGAFGDQDGCLAHCGTGSFLALKRDGKLQLAGGWGHVLGDEASGNWLGKQALRSLMAVADGLRPASMVSEQTEEIVGSATSAVDLAASAEPFEIATLAPMVVRAAEAGDEAARNILANGADYLEAMLKRMGWTEDMAVSLTGSVAPAYAEYFSDEMREKLQPPKATPLDGALDLARAFAGELVLG